MAIAVTSFSAFLKIAFQKENLEDFRGNSARSAILNFVAYASRGKIYLQVSSH